ncbi:MAG: putative heme transporter [Solirubrobacteraceae bacterium]|nr:putative heme transporter [Solirubrobacteraceae bacterium]
MSGRLGDRVEHAIEQHADVEEAVERAEAEPRRDLKRTIFWLVVTGVSLYLVAPSVLDVLGSYEDLQRIAPGWLVAMAVAQGAALACLWALQRLAIHVRGWYPVVTSQLAGNALAKVAPGGGAIGAALQYRMLVTAGVERPAAVSGLTATSLLTLAVVLAMPVLAIPALIRGSVAHDLLVVSVLGLALFAVLATIATVLLASDRPIGWLGRTIQRVRNRVRPSAEPLRRFPERLVRERDRILGTIGPRWKRAVLATVGRWTFDYATLLAAVAAVGAGARPGLVLLAFCAAQLLAQIPVTPGGLGFVEAGLTAMLVLAGVDAGAAVLATFAYRLVSYWLPLPVGLVAWVLHRRRYGAEA